MRPDKADLRIFRTILGLGAAAVAVLLLATSVTVHAIESPGVSRDPKLDSKQSSEMLAEGRKALSAFSLAFQDAAARVTSSVVPVYSEKLAGANELPFDNDFFRRFFGDIPEGRVPDARPQRGIGSGVIVSEDGYILTNNHVVDGADKVTVVLDGKNRHVAAVIGTDPQSDLAVIKVDAHALNAAILGDSDAVSVGQWVIAVGNPFELTHTVTTGIVSATGRSSVGLANFENFIQTDASINPGNSGGALADLDGRVIGINTAISSPSGGNVGIGFAIPINMARNVMQQLIDTGQVARGFLGLVPQDIDRALAAALSLPSTEGALVGDVTPDSPADRAGIRRGDVLLSVDGQPIRDSAGLRNDVAAQKPGSKVTLTVLRGGSEQTVKVKLGERPGEVIATGRTHPADSDSESRLGIAVRPLTPELAQQLHVEADSGVVIERIMPATPAADSELRRGDVIAELNRKPIHSVSDFNDAVLALKPGDAAALWVERGELGFYAAIEVKS